MLFFSYLFTLIQEKQFFIAFPLLKLKLIKALIILIIYWYFDFSLKSSFDLLKAIHLALILKFIEIFINLLSKLNLFQFFLTKFIPKIIHYFFILLGFYLFLLTLLSLHPYFLFIFPNFQFKTNVPDFIPIIEFIISSYYPLNPLRFNPISQIIL